MKNWYDRYTYRVFCQTKTWHKFDLHICQIDIILTAIYSLGNRVQSINIVDIGIIGIEITSEQNQIYGEVLYIVLCRPDWHSEMTGLELLTNIQSWEKHIRKEICREKSSSRNLRRRKRDRMKRWKKEGSRVLKMRRTTAYFHRNGKVWEVRE